MLEVHEVLEAKYNITLRRGDGKDKQGTMSDNKYANYCSKRKL